MRRDLLHAAAKGDTAQVTRLLAEGVSPDGRGTNGMLPLMVAAGRGHDAVVALLLEHGADVNLASAITGGTALTMASWRGHESTVRLLKRHGALIADEAGASALVGAAAGGHTGTARFLLEEGAYVDPVALILAARSGHAGIVELLLEHGANKHAIDKQRRTAIWWARKKGFAEIEEMLR